MKISVDMSDSESNSFGTALCHLWYSNKSLLDLAPSLSGYPHNGGEHTMRIAGEADECKAFLELVKESYPKHAASAVDKMIEAIDQGEKRILWRKLKPTKVVLTYPHDTPFGAVLTDILSSNESLLAKAPNCDSKAMVGSVNKMIIEGTPDQCTMFLALLKESYPDSTEFIDLLIADVERGFKYVNLSDVLEFEERHKADKLSA